MRIDVYSHSFEVTEVSTRQKGAVEHFCRTLIQYEMVKEDGVMRRKMARTFASAFHDRRYYRFHVNLLNDFLKILAYYQINDREFTKHTHALEVSDDWRVEFDVKSLFEPRDQQPALIEHILKPGANKIINLQTGGGKAQPHWSRIRTPGGWTTMREVKVGDKVIAKDGTVTEVTGTYPQGRIQTYRVVFGDGRYVECCADHLWLVYQADDGIQTPGTVMSTLQLMSMLDVPNTYVFIDLIDADEGLQVGAKTDLYKLGLRLGKCPSVEWTDPEVTHEWASFPTEYLDGSKEQRLSLLQGLLDSGGFTRTTGRITFHTQNKDIAKGLVYLARSFGAFAATRRETKVCPWYRISIRHRDPASFFRTPQRINADYSTDCKLRVRSVRKGRMAESKCISIAHPDKLYVTDNFIVTHNTFITKYAMNKMGLRTVGFMKGGFIDRWVPDLEETFKFKKGELLVVRGGAPLNAIMEMALEGRFKQATCVMISINSFTEYLKDYERNGITEQYPIAPGQFFEKLGFGFGFLDEGHQNPHQVMKMFSYMNINKFLTLSATLDTKDKFMSQMLEVMYPREDRFNAGFYRVYIRVKGIKFQLHRPKAIRYKGFGGAYNHSTFEASLMSHKCQRELKNYIDLIMWTLKVHFLDVMEKGQKALIFCGTIKFCTLLTKHIQRHVRHLNVVRYVGEDKMSVLQEGDIIVSTVQSAGTAVDIPNLRLGLATTAVDSQQSNEQTLGRTRPLKDFPGVDPMFLYFICTDIPQHIRYSSNKEAYFKGKVLSHGYEQAPITI